MKSKKIITLILTILILCAFAPNASAVYQSVSDKKSTNTFNNWKVDIRNMEATGDVMGLTEEHDITTLESTTGSNNIDAHMIKNTEYGAVLILSASLDYGKSAGTEGETGTASSTYIHLENNGGLATTTGNAYGVYGLGNSGNTTSEYEIVAAGGEKVSGTTEFHDKYYNRYTNNSTPIGDAMETYGSGPWKSSGWNNYYSDLVKWLPGSSNVYVRGISSYYSKNYMHSAYSFNGGFNISTSAYTRACIVNGAGI